MASTELAASGNEYTLTRMFDAPRLLVWRAWTTPAMLGQWFGPHGFTCPVCQVDLRVGGRYRIVMRSPEGKDYPLRGSYLEIAEPERLVMSVETDEHPPEWHEMVNRERGTSEPEGALTWTVTLAEQGGRTRVTVVNRFGSAADRDAHIRLGAYDGWSQSFEKMEALMESGRAHR